MNEQKKLLDRINKKNQNEFGPICEELYPENGCEFMIAFCTCKDGPVKYKDSKYFANRLKYYQSKEEK